MRWVKAVSLATLVIGMVTISNGAERRYLPRTSEYSSTPYPYEDIVPGGWKSLMPLAKKQLSVTNIVIYPALSTFIRYEGRLPRDIREVLDSPYSPVSSADLKDPVLGISYADLKQGQVLSEWYSFDEATDLSKAVITVTQYWRDPWSGEAAQVAYRHAATKFLHRSLDPENCVLSRYDRRSVDIRDVTAEVVRHALRMAAGEFKRHHRRAPLNHNEVVSTFPYLERVKNPYTGGFARLEGSIAKADVSTTPLKKGTPGNFVFIEDSFLPWYILFGADGDPISVTPTKIPVGPCPATR